MDEEKKPLLAAKSAPALADTNTQPRAIASEPELPTPYMKIYLIGAMLLVNHFSIFVIPTFLPFMVEDFFPGQPLSSLVIQYGALNSAFNAGQFFSGAIWGSLADRIGRRPVLIFGLLGTLLGILMFGFAPNYWVALVARLLWGVLNGNIPVAKTYLSEVCDEKSQAKGFAVIGTAQSIGRLVAPILGGYLAQPSLKYPNVFPPGSLFDQFRYCLPMVVGSVFCVGVLVLSVIHLNESLPEEKRVRFKSVDGKKKSQESVMALMIRDSNVGKSVSLFVLLSFVSTFLEDMIPAWLVLAVASGGFQMSSSEIGLLMTISAPVPFLFQSLLFAPSVFYMGYKLVFARSMLMAGLGCLLLPFANTLYRNQGVYISSFIYIAVMFSVYLVGRFYAFAAVYALINNSCDSQRGAVNGYAQSVSTGSRMIASEVGNLVLGATVASGSTSPLTDFHLVFYIAAFICVVTAYIDYTLPDSINSKPKKDGSRKALSIKDVVFSADSRVGLNAPPSSDAGYGSRSEGKESEALLSRVDDDEELDLSGAPARRRQVRSGLSSSAPPKESVITQPLGRALLGREPSLDSKDGDMVDAEEQESSEEESVNPGNRRHIQSVPIISQTRKRRMRQSFYPARMKDEIQLQSKSVMSEFQMTPQ